MSVQAGDITQERIGRLEVGVEGLIQLTTQFGQSAVERRELRRQGGSPSEGDFPLRHGSRLGRQGGESIEEVGQAGRQLLTAADPVGSRGAARAGVATINALTQKRLRQLQSTLLGIQRPAHTALGDHLSVEDFVADLANGHRLGSRTHRIGESVVGGGRLDGNPLPGVGRVVDVGQIVPGHLDALPLGGQRAGSHSQCSNQAKHTIRSGWIQPTASYMRRALERPPSRDPSPE